MFVVLAGAFFLIAEMQNIAKFSLPRAPQDRSIWQCLQWAEV
jgi:hypothetical protein